ncbi:MAG: HAD family hydrolase [Paracoccaceae bacterium]|nr:HAD family hydrolase [Paracoccaceae bacterium]MDG1739459.1 HAD family hydrolase [Paracoccaceae bacterium]MDG2258623.1 HAD family hydrolase [Paracoccaceae bacterium]
MAAKPTIIAFDADDTLWHNERFFKISQDRFAQLLLPYTEPDHLSERLIAAERRNLGRYGYGIKGFMLSMIETAIEVTDQQIPAAVISDLLAVGQDMLAHPIDLFPGVVDVIAQVSQNHQVLLITKGDLLDQERKLAQSGIGDHFDGVEIVSEKQPATYAKIFAGYGVAPQRAMMIGNSMKSDVLPALAIGAWGIHVPFDLTWALEHAEKPENQPRFRELSKLTELPDLLGEIEL